MDDLLQSDTGSIEDALKGRYLTFIISEDIFGIEIINVMEIVGLQPVTEMPETPDYIKGVVNLRGKIIPVVDVRVRFKKPQIDYTDRTCIIIIECDGITAGLIVDSVSDVLTISDEDIVEKPEISRISGKGYVKSIGKLGDKTILLLDCIRLINDET
jgi:Chemotaxis signal transduction protein